MLMECADAIYKVHPKAPVKYGDILIENLCGTGCNVIATSDSE
jgi:CxxC motif-containing protein